MANFDSLWGDEFSIKEPPKTKKLLEKINNPKKVKTVEQTIKSKTVDIETKLKFIDSEVHRILGKYEEDTMVIKTKEELVSYIDKSIENGIIAIDTETNNSLDPITCKIMGGCIYTPGLKNAYIPINHIDRTTKERLEWQLTEQDLGEQFSRLSNTKIIMHNGKFDYEVIKCTCGVCLDIYWDTMIGAKLLDENEHSAGLKEQYRTKIDPTQDKYDIEHLFEKMEYSIFAPELFALYAATDSFITYKLYEWQVKEFDKPENSKILKLLKEIEMPVIHVLAEMELAGMEVDQDYAQRLSAKYHKQLDEIDANINLELAKLKPKIDAWRLTPEAIYQPPKKTGEGLGKSKCEQLTDPINLGSPTQLAILFYDVLKCPTVSKKQPRGTGEEQLKSLYEKKKLEIFNLILQRRECVKLVDTYIDSIPELAKRWPDGRVRTHFNQYGAQTGRLSSSDPLNFQNIPSHNKSIRMLFKAAEGRRIVGADYSAQEPRLTARYSEDENMIGAYTQGKDLYSVIASMSFDRKYEDCLEFYPEGTEIEFEGQKVICGYKTHQNKEGKNYRSQAKAILLGVLYGRGAASVGEQIGKSRDEAQEIIDKFFNAFPKVKKWIDESVECARTNGYVEDIIGRRRRLPDIQLPRYEVTSELTTTNFNPLIGASGQFNNQNAQIIESYKSQLNRANSKKEVDAIKAEAATHKINIRDNTGFIAQAERQAVNARVQGGAATLTKAALIKIYNDQRLKDIGAFLINTVHDEILMEVPIENSELCEKYLSEDMIKAAEAIVQTVPMASDTYNVRAWYADEMGVQLEADYNKLKDKNTENIMEVLYNKYSELTKEQIDNFIYNHVGLEE